MSRAEVDDSTFTEIAEACNVSASQIEDIYDCLPQQLDQIAEKRSEQFQFVLSFGPAADPDRWCEALRQIVSLNAVLRTRFVHCRRGIVQVITNEEHVTERQSGDVEQYLRDEQTHRLGLGVPLFQSTFIDRHFVATIHHAIMDYWSVTTFLKEDVARVYFGHAPIQRPAFKEFVAHCLNIDESEAKSFWASRFKGVPAIFPKINPQYSPHPSGEETRKVILDRIGNGVSPAHVPWFTEAAWALTAARYADSESVGYGLVLSGRSSSLNGIESSLGPAVVEVPVQVNLQRNMTVERFIMDRATSLRQLQAHPALQYGNAKISKVNEAAHTASGFQTLLNIVPAMPISLPTSTEGSDVTFERMVWRARGSFSLMLQCNIHDDGILVESRYDPEILCEDQLRRILNQFEHMLQVLMGAPMHMKLDNLQRLNRFDHAEILSWNKIVPEPVEGCLHELFIAQARAQPEAIAVEASDGNATYRELDEMSGRLAHELYRRGVLPRSPVAFIIEKSLWTIVAILGILKAGGACVPIDKDDPYHRKANIISNSNIKNILTSSKEYSGSLDLAPDVFVVSAESIAALPAVARTLNIGMRSSKDLAYIIFTSGSTGIPKGVMLEHRGLVSQLTSLARRFGWQPGCRMLQFAAHASNISISEIFGVLLFGGCLCLPSQEVQTSNLSAFIASNNVNWAMLTPTVLRGMSPSDVPSLQSLLSFGDPIDAEVSKLWAESLNFFNGWEACEASALSTVAEVIPTSHCPDSIGTPVGCAVWLVNPQNIQELVSIGSVGELLIEGPGVARGYVNEETKTASSFIPPPLWASSSGRTVTQFYRTGDLAKYNPDGSIAFIGRLSNRIKYSGQIVQLEEVENVIASCEEVRDVVTLSKISAGRTQLVAVVCLADPHLPQKEFLRELSDGYAKLVEERLSAVRIDARSKLPLDRLPAIWHTVEQLPRTGSGKLDRVAVRAWLSTLHS